MEIGHLIPHIEALIFASDKPLTALELTELINNAFGFMEDKIVLDQVESALEGIVEKYKSEFYPFEVRESGGGWQFLTKRDYHKTVAQLNGDKFLKRLSTAALEALSIIAYKQPVTKAEIEAIRGVSSDYAIQKLLEKELIVITGRNEKMPGHPLVYGTSKNFMDYFGINTAEDLPKLKEVFDEAMVNATNVNEAIAEQASNEEAARREATVESGEADTILAVAENGELIVGTTGASGEHLNGEAVHFEPSEGSTGEEGEEEATDTDTEEEDLIIEDITIEEIEEDPGPDYTEEPETDEKKENGEDDDDDLGGEDLEEDEESDEDEEEDDLEEEDGNEGEEDEEGEDDGEKRKR